LAAFQEVGLVRLCYFHNGTSLYQIALDNENPYHIVSKDTNEVEQLDPENSAELRSLITRIEENLRARGYTDVSHLVEFFAQKPKNSRESVAASMPNVNVTSMPNRQAAPVIKAP
jgi:Fur family transcriptional regulator, ferric uptake regulator